MPHIAHFFMTTIFFQKANKSRTNKPLDLFVFLPLDKAAGKRSPHQQ
ncbi:hypothetical protein HMPREF3039_00411 [Akkermansia sp. KLE1798]|nr:hypothetical protein HMPREF3039_00411 [Akkermansia sp. KLE1798]KZA04526.1 hypothetical protein HMPREF1326_01809 [Akkermansia sp. KLE1605]